MKRRTFLKTTLVAAGAVISGARCGGSNGGGGPKGGARWFPQSVASGDPRPDGVVLWTRVEDAGRAGEDLALALEVALDEGFEQVMTLGEAAALTVTAEADFDHCVKVRVSGLEPGTTYFYRFTYERDGARYASRTGRTRTAPAEDADVPVRFAVVSCQDMSGRWFHSYRRLAELAREGRVDFVVHLGDYIYESIGDARFQETDAERAPSFRHPEDALMPEGEGGRIAARTVDNYRDLYRAVRGDADLQAVHELVPFVVTWDDHEFSDDAHGATGTYTDGREDERDVARRKAANQAWFEYMPVDYRGGESFRYDPQSDFPGDLLIYRDLVFGRHMHLVMTDERTFRPDHIIPEDAWPAGIAATQAQLEDAFGEVPELAVPYIDVEVHEDGRYLPLLRDEAEAAGYDAARVTGPASVPYINALIAETSSDLPPVEDDAAAGLPRGVAWHQAGKSPFYATLGARYFIAKDAYELIAAQRWAESDGASEDLLGREQERWFLDTIRGSDRTWKVWGNELMLTTHGVDLRALDRLPEEFRQRFLITADDWDGFPNRRDALLAELAGAGNVVAFTGDIHAFFAGTPATRPDASKKIVELVCGAVSSNALKGIIVQLAQSNETLQRAGAAALALILEEFLLNPETKPNPHLAFADTERHGFAAVELDGEKMDVTFHHGGSFQQQLSKIPPAELAAPLSELMTTTRFRVEAGSPELYREIDGAWKRWDPESTAWV